MPHSITKVLFPRFEFEASWQTDQRIYENIPRAQWRNWLPEDAVQLLLNPSVIANIANETPWRRISNGHWWGARHEIRELHTPARQFTPPKTADQKQWGLEATPRAYQALHIQHDYHWDEQAPNHRVREVVLEDVTAEPREVMAVLVDAKQEHPDLQKVVIADKTGEWREPIFGMKDKMWDFYLSTVVDLCELPNPVASTPTENTPTLG